jgi:hypothetical protein
MASTFSAWASFAMILRLTCFFAVSTWAMYALLTSAASASSSWDSPRAWRSRRKFVANRSRRSSAIRQTNRPCLIPYPTIVYKMKTVCNRSEGTGSQVQLPGVREPCGPDSAKGDD